MWSTTGWVLIFYLSGYNSGGPAVAVFGTEKACQNAIEVTSKALSNRWGGGVCVRQNEDLK